jgi:hypothetical protein
MARNKVKANKCQHVINAFLLFKKSLDGIAPRIPRKMAGDIGEFYVLQAMQKLGYDCTHKSGQVGCDIILNGTARRIEVRTSLLKNEGIYPKGINFYGWRVKDRGARSEDKFDILVCVALDDSFKKPRFYVFTKQEAFSAGDVHIGRFPRIQKKITLFENPTAYKKAIKTKPKLVTKFERYFNLNSKVFLNKWSKLNKIDK